MYYKIVIIEDNTELLEFLKLYLKEKGSFQVKCYADGVAALKDLKIYKPDLVVIDLVLKDLKGLTICVELREMYPDLPIIILTADNSKESKISCLNAGADDYVTKPFDAEELLARINTKLRKNFNTDTTLEIEDLSLNTDTLEVQRGGKRIELTAKEFELLRYLIINKERVLSRDKILNAIWGYDASLDTRVVDVHIGKLRGKINNGFKKKLIETYRGFGYKIA